MAKYELKLIIDAPDFSKKSLESSFDREKFGTVMDFKVPNLDKECVSNLDFYLKLEYLKENIYILSNAINKLKPFYERIEELREMGIKRFFDKDANEEYGNLTYRLQQFLVKDFSVLFSEVSS